MRYLRWKSLGWIAAVGASGSGCTDLTRPDLDARGQLAVPAMVAPALPLLPRQPSGPSEPLAEPPRPELILDPRDPFPMAFTGAVRVVARPVAEPVSASLPAIEPPPAAPPAVAPEPPIEPDTHVAGSELPKQLAIRLSIPDAPAAETPVKPHIQVAGSELPKPLAIPLSIPEAPVAEPRAIPELVPPPVPANPTPAADAPIQGVPDTPAVGSVSVGGQPVSFDRIASLVSGGDGTATKVLTGGCPSCGSAGGGGCAKCEPFPAEGGLATRVVARVYEALCCPDPCYKPKWIPLADSAFFTSSARPVTQTRLRWDYTRYNQFVDRGEYFFARADGNGKGPKPVAGFGIPRVDMHELQQYTETAAGPAASAYVITPYRSVNLTNGNPSSAAGFGDITVGTKAVLFDSELFILTMQFQTTLPVGNAGKGLGTGHVSLEPSLLFGLRVSPLSYLQGQLAEWIPIAGDPTYSGAMLHYHLSYNHVLWQPISQVQLIGTFEMNGYSWQDGGFTDPATGFRSASGSNILQLGPGLRMFYCDKYDFGVGSNFGVTGKNSLGQQFRFEMRIRY